MALTLFGELLDDSRDPRVVERLSLTGGGCRVRRSAPRELPSGYELQGGQSSVPPNAPPLPQPLLPAGVQDQQEAKRETTALTLWKMLNTSLFDNQRVRLRCPSAHTPSNNTTQWSSK